MAYIEFHKSSDQDKDQCQGSPMQGILSSESDDDVKEQDYALDGNAQDMIDSDQLDNI